MISEQIESKLLQCRYIGVNVFLQRVVGAWDKCVCCTCQCVLLISMMAKSHMLIELNYQSKVEKQSCMQPYIEFIREHKQKFIFLVSISSSPTFKLNHYNKSTTGHRLYLFCFLVHIQNLEQRVLAHRECNIIIQINIEINIILIKNNLFQSSLGPFYLYQLRGSWDDGKDRLGPMRYLSLRQGMYVKN